MILLRVLVALAGASIVTGTLLSAARTVVVPRAEHPFITRVLFKIVQLAFRHAAVHIKSLERRERLLSRLVPVSLLSIPFVWSGFIVLGAALVYWAFGLAPLDDAIIFSGSAFTTFGFAGNEATGLMLLAVAQGVLGLEIIALLVSFLPSIYNHFTHRETPVTRLEALAGSPCDPSVMLARAHRIGLIGSMDSIWHDWANWFAGLEESHTTFSFLAFFRSPHPERSWLTAGVCVLDAAALEMALVDEDNDRYAPLCLRTGYLALRRVGDEFGIEYPKDPAPGDPISISRAEFDDVVAEFKTAGVPLRSDLDQAWVDFAGWRVNYDQVALGLAELILAPPSRFTARASLPTKAQPRSQPAS